MSVPSDAVRRGPLDGAHDELGARRAANGRGWPLHYGDPASEAASAAADMGLAEVGPLDIVLVRGPDAAAAAGALRGASDVWALARDEVLVLVHPEAGSATVVEALSSVDLSVVDLSSAWTALRIAGPKAPALLGELSPLALHPREMAEGAIAQGPLANVRAIIRRRDAPVGPGYTILVAREAATYVWTAIMELGRVHGLRPVGQELIAPRDT